MALTQDQIEAIYAKRRRKGEYAVILNDQREGDENGFAAKATYPTLKSKSATTIYQGFRNAAEKLSLTDVVDIINSDDEVFVLFTDRVELATA
jgi:hypothetical protein